MLQIRLSFLKLSIGFPTTLKIKFNILSLACKVMLEVVLMWFDLISYHFPACSLCFSHTNFSWFIDMRSTFQPQGLCICCSFHLEWSSSRLLHGSFPHYIQISAQISPPQKDIPIKTDIPLTLLNFSSQRLELSVIMLLFAGLSVSSIRMQAQTWLSCLTQCSGVGPIAW